MAYSWLSNSPVRFELSEDVIAPRKIKKCRQTKQYTQASCANWKLFFLCWWAGNWRINLIAIYFYGFLPWFFSNAFLSEVTSEISDVARYLGLGMRFLTGSPFQVLSTLHTSNHFKTHTWSSFSPHFTHTTSYLKLFMASYYSLATKEKTPLNIIHTIWPFLQLLSTICVVAILVLFCLYLSPSPTEGFSACASLDNYFHPSSWSIHSYLQTSALVLPPQGKVLSCVDQIPPVSPFHCICHTIFLVLSIVMV